MTLEEAARAYRDAWHALEAARSEDEREAARAALHRAACRLLDLAREGR